MKCLLLTVSLICGLALAESDASVENETPPEIKFSDVASIKYTNESEGDMTFSYKTYLKGKSGFEEAWMNGKIVI